MNVLQQIKKDCLILQSKLHNPPPMGGCVIFQRLLKLSGPKCGEIENALKRSPREKQLQEVIRYLRTLLHFILSETKTTAAMSALRMTSWQLQQKESLREKLLHRERIP